MKTKYTPAAIASKILSKDCSPQMTLKTFEGEIMKLAEKYDIGHRALAPTEKKQLLCDSIETVFSTYCVTDDSESCSIIGRLLINAWLGMIGIAGIEPHCELCDTVFIHVLANTILRKRNSPCVFLDWKYDEEADMYRFAEYEVMEANRSCPHPTSYRLNESRCILDNFIDVKPGDERIMTLEPYKS